jgi:hypothetical protein
MSLIPSESYSFPDHFTTTVAGSRKPKNIEPEPEAEPFEPPRKKPTIVALPNPKPQPPPAPVAARQNPEPVRKVSAPNPALRRAAALPPRISEPPVRKIALPPTLKPKVRWNTRAPAMDPASTPNNGNRAEHVPQESLMPPAENVIQMKPPQPVARPPRVMPRPENVPVAPPARPVSAPPPPKPMPVARHPVQPVRDNPSPMAPANPQADFFEAFAQSGETAIPKRRRKAKMRRFIVYQSIALSILLPLAYLGLTFRAENAVLHWAMNILTIAAAFAAALIPILFFAATPTLPEIER